MSLKEEQLHVCKTLDEMFALVRLPLTAHSSKQVVMRTIDVPLSEDDYDLLSAPEINLYRPDNEKANTSGRRVKMSYPKQMSPFTITMDQPFIATGLCITLLGDPVSESIEGNTFGPQDQLLSVPASPINVRHQTGALAALLGREVGDGDYVCPAILDHGGPVWRFVYWLMQSWRVVWECPGSAYQTLLNERLSDVGTCIPLPKIEGFSNAEVAVQVITRLCNDRLHRLANNTDGESFPTVATPVDAAAAIVAANAPYFVPLNSEQNSDFEITPYRYIKDKQAYGSMVAMPGYENWIRLPIPMPLDVTTKIKLQLEMEDKADEEYRDLALSEIMMRQCVGPIPALDSAGCFFPIDEADKAADADGGIACHTIIPFGKMRIGLGIRGFEIRENVCALYRRMLKDKALLPQIMNHEYSPSDGCQLGSVSGPSIEETVITHLNGSGQKPEVDEVPGGFVGDPE